MRLLALALVTAVFAACVQDDARSDDCSVPLDPAGIRYVEPTADPIAPLAEGDPWDFDLTNVRTCSLPAIGWTALSEAGPHKYIGEIDMRGDLDLGAVAVLGNGEAPMVYILDISDRAMPTVVSVIEQAATYIVDVKFSDDGKILYTASQSIPTSVEFIDADHTTAPVGFTAYDVSDPAAPVYLGAVLDTQIGCHMLDPVQVAATQDAVFCISQHVRSYLIERGGATLVNLGFVEYVPSNAAGVPTPSVPVLGDPTCALPTGCILTSGPHDMTAYHEGDGSGDGRSYMVVSHWDSGVRVLDFTDAPLVTEVGAWNGEGAVHYSGNVHTAMMFDTADGRFILASPEYTSDGTVPSLWLLSADDLGDLRLVAEWYHPGNHTSQGLYLTTHQWQVGPTGDDVPLADVHVYLTYNHAGIWVLDLGAVLAGDNLGAVLGFNLARAPLDEATAVGNAVLSTWDVNVVDGYIYGSDRATGLWVFHYAGDTLGDERLRGFA